MDRPEPGNRYTIFDCLCRPFGRTQGPRKRYETLYYGWLWRVLYRYDWQNKYTIYENGLRERPSEERIAQICKNIG